MRLSVGMEFARGGVHSLCDAHYLYALHHIVKGFCAMQHELWWRIAQILTIRLNRALTRTG